MRGGPPLVSGDLDFPLVCLRPYLVAEERCYASNVNLEAKGSAALSVKAKCVSISGGGMIYLNRPTT